MMNEVFIVTGPVGIGKSTLLSAFFSKNTKPAHGFLCLKNESTDMRELHLLSNNFRIPYETKETETNSLSVGKFHFLKSAFSRAIEELETFEGSQKIAVIDEIGKLEIEGNTGFEPEFSEWYYKKKNNSLLVVVRSSLLKQAIEKYGWQNAKINIGPWMPQVPNLMGLVLAGGRSSRMGKDKKAIAYHGKPQWVHALELLQSLGLDTVVNASDIQSDSVRVIEDSTQFSGNGPVSGLLSVSGELEQTALLVLGIDYPELDAETLHDLIRSYQIRNCSVCYRNSLSNRVEPVIAIYHPRDLKEIRNNFFKSQTSLSAYWENAGDSVLILPHKNPRILKSYDLPEDETAFRTR